MEEIKSATESLLRDHPLVTRRLLFASLIHLLAISRTCDHFFGLQKGDDCQKGVIVQKSFGFSTNSATIIKFRKDTALKMLNSANIKNTISFFRGQKMVERVGGPG